MLAVTVLQEKDAMVSEDEMTSGRNEIPLGETVIEVRHLVKRYGQQVAVNGLSFSVRRGEIFGLLGPNGAGKTTTLEIIEGIRRADSGSVCVLGLDIQQQRRAVQERIGVQLQATTLFPFLRVRETLTLFAAFYRRSLPVDDLLQLVALQEKAAALPEELSGGQRQRLALALALVNDPDLLFLDEPTSGLDPQSRRALWEMVERLRDRGKTVILTTHFMDEAQHLCDRIAIIDHGQIIALDTTAGLLSRLGSGATIEYVGNGHSPAGSGLRPEELERLPGVSAVSQGLEHTLISTEEVERTLMALFQLAGARGIALDHLQIYAPTLEDLFLKLTGRSLRD
jgi:ABC-2 type transport system ATP-binding protein